MSSTSARALPRRGAIAVLLLCACGIAVDTTSGTEVGHEIDGQIMEYLGIRYAEPPVGPLRFAPPVARAKQTDQHWAGSMGASCETAEDCLFLNVWAPKDADKLPVMLFIHGGAYTMGSAPNAAALARKGHVVTVTINYRLGVFGFLAHPALPSTNFGLLDQQLAMKWVRDNIAAFGGDASNVTIFGESAGAGSVCAHLASKTAAGLFDRAIEESGSCTLGFLPKARAELTGQHVVDALHCTGDAVQCLRDASADDLRKAVPAKLELDANADKWVPVADGTVVPLDAMAAFTSGDFNRVPFLSGTNANEGSLFTASMQLDTRADFEALVQKAAPDSATQLIAFYSESAYPVPRDAATAMLNDVFVCGQRQQARDIVPYMSNT